MSRLGTAPKTVKRSSSPWPLLAISLLLAACNPSFAGSSPDAGAPQEEWDGHCRGKKDAGRRAVWRGTVYVCKDNGPPNHWYFVQDPDFYGVRM